MQERGNKRGNKMLSGVFSWGGGGLVLSEGIRADCCKGKRALLLAHSGYFILYATLSLASMVYLYLFFPETKGKTLEEVEVRGCFDVAWLSSSSIMALTVGTTTKHIL